MNWEAHGILEGSVHGKGNNKAKDQGCTTLAERSAGRHKATSKEMSNEMWTGVRENIFSIFQKRDQGFFKIPFKSEKGSEACIDILEGQRRHHTQREK